MPQQLFTFPQTSCLPCKHAVLLLGALVTVYTCSYARRHAHLHAGCSCECSRPCNRIRYKGSTPAMIWWASGVLNSAMPLAALGNWSSSAIICFSISFLPAKQFWSYRGAMFAKSKSVRFSKILKRFRTAAGLRVQADFACCMGHIRSVAWKIAEFIKADG